MTTALLTKKEVAAQLRISTRTLDRLRAGGQLRATKVLGTVRFTAAELDRFITKNTGKNAH
ncbi:MAG: helix-turn-helix domain-containing protein [Gemmataceae bacterium]